MSFIHITSFKQQKNHPKSNDTYSTVFITFRRLVAWLSG